MTFGLIFFSFDKFGFYRQNISKKKSTKLAVCSSFQRLILFHILFLVRSPKLMIKTKIKTKSGDVYFYLLLLKHKHNIWSFFTNNGVDQILHLS